ncbi:hypothetical protein [Sinomicrobium sp. M5D2P17]
MKKYAFYGIFFLILVFSHVGFSSGFPSTYVFSPAVTGETVEVRITYVDIHGNPAEGNVMVSGLYAVDQDSGETYYADREGVFQIPEGTYRFDAERTGPWEGIVPKVETIEAAGPYVVVELTHWYE